MYSNAPEEHIPSRRLSSGITHLLSKNNFEKPLPPYVKNSAILLSLR